MAIVMVGERVELLTDAERARRAISALYFCVGCWREPRPPKTSHEPDRDGGTQFYVRVGDFAYRAPTYVAAVEGAARWIAAERLVALSWRRFLERA